MEDEAFAAGVVHCPHSVAAATGGGAVRCALIGSENWARGVIDRLYLRITNGKST